MEEYGYNTLPASRGLMRELHALGAVEAPGSILPDVMTRLGLGDAYTLLATPIGEVFVAYNDHGISAVALAADAAGFESHFRAQCGRRAYRVPAAPAALAGALERGIRGSGRSELRFDLRGLSQFERAVLLKALEIPRGEVRPYSWVAREIGNPKAVRAVGSALGHNPIPLFIPCHRVVRSDGHIGHYSMGGAETKRAILTAEGVEPEALEHLARAGVRYIGSDTTRVYCLPTCRYARRIGNSHRVPFRSENAAAAAGYRPCKVCRPAANVG